MYHLKIFTNVLIKQCETKTTTQEFEMEIIYTTIYSRH